MISIGDNLRIMRGMPRDSVDLIATDPPFNTRRDFAQFTDKWSELDYAEISGEPLLRRLIEVTAEMDKGLAAYLCFMAPRLLEMRRILKPTGSIYLHCDPSANSYLRLLMDAVFGRKNFRNEIVWCYTGPGSPKMRQFNRKHDTIFWYSNGPTWTFNRDAARVPYKNPNQMPVKAFDTGDSFNEDKIADMRKKGKILETWWPQEPGNGLCVVARQKERTGWATQKPVALYERIIKASSNEGDVVFDPFCGSGTTLVAAQNLNRKPLGCDINPDAAKTLQDRF